MAPPADAACNDPGRIGPWWDVPDDEAALRSVFEAEHERLWRSLLAYAGDADLASDAPAEAFAQALWRGDGLRDPAAWVWRAAFRDGRTRTPMSGTPTRPAVNGGYRRCGAVPAAMMTPR